MTEERALPATGGARSAEHPIEDRVHVGAQDAYEPRCRVHFSPEPQPRTEPPQQELLPFLR